MIICIIIRVCRTSRDALISRIISVRISIRKALLHTSSITRVSKWIKTFQNTLASTIISKVWCQTSQTTNSSNNICIIVLRALQHTNSLITGQIMESKSISPIWTNIYTNTGSRISETNRTYIHTYWCTVISVCTFTASVFTSWC